MKRQEEGGPNHMQAKIRLEHELLAVESEHRVHAMLELLAPAAPADRQRPPLHLALVIDRSGSMRGPKLATTKECAAFLVRRLAPTDELALVTYDDTVRLLAAAAPVGQATQALLAAIDAIPLGGQTNLSGGWLKGVETLQGERGAGVRKVLLLTDGLANVGITDQRTLVEMARNAAAADSGVGTTTIGFGADFAEELLTAMADAGRGNAHFAETPDQAPGIFAQEFEGLMSMVAQNLSVEIRPSPEVQMVSVLNEYPVVGVPGGFQLQLGDAYAEERRRVVFELHIPELARLGVAKVAEVVVRYVVIGEEIAAHELTLPITVNMVSADEAAAGEADVEVVEEVLVLKAAMAEDEARKKADEGDFEGAKALLQSTAGKLREMAPESSKAVELLRQAEDMEIHSASMSPARYDAVMRKRMLFESYSKKRRGGPGHLASLKNPNRSSEFRRRLRKAH
jgi:Ca-activated chloride channel homolog